MIEEYHFGSILINDKNYENDVEVRSISPKGNKIEVLDWRREEDHVVDIGDLEEAVEENPEVIVIGTGYSGSAKVTTEAQKFIKDQGIKLIIDITGEAVKIFNIILEESEEEEGGSKRIIAFFHLTC